MAKRGLERFSIEELEQTLHRRKRSLRQQRLQRLKAAGRVVEVAEHPAPIFAERPPVAPTETHPPLVAANGTDTPPSTASPTASSSRTWRWLTNKVLLGVEVAAVIGLIIVFVGTFRAMREINADVALGVEQQVVSLSPTAPPLIDLVVLPSGHKPPVDGRPPQPGEAGDIPAHLLPIIDAYVPPPEPEVSPQHARTVRVEAINVNHSVVQGDDWEQLKKGIGHHIGSALPGQLGNMVLSAHNDIYGEIFRHLDKLALGDVVEVATDRNQYLYSVTEIRVVEPTEVWVMEPTEHASLTLISCYPYLINNKRIVVFAELIEGEALQTLQQG